MDKCNLNCVLTQVIFEGLDNINSVKEKYL